MQLIETHLVPILEKPIRLQEYGVGVFKTTPTKSGIKKAIKKGLLLVDKKTTTSALFINGGETIELYQTEENDSFKRLELKLDVLFEDDFLAIIYKPAGILVSGNSFVTIDNALSQNLQKSTQFDAVRPRPVHRLDYPTSGVLLIGKTNASILALNKLFENKEIQKTYHAICIGKMNSEGKINNPIDNKEAITNYKVIEMVVSERFKFLNLVKLNPKTGRKHQLRKHLSENGNQILGDKEYGKEELQLKGKGLYLHASSLEFEHPFTHEKISVIKELPKKFRKIFPAF
ncbi:23S rRNA pseudouridine1911/1915/1917 synthase [Lutibacter sp. Hel_I_33_5]|uniref:RluA family pseudouridine synthase n=1 Tax=Lutibacter sp. Hel_I_33_5 TaxID=1566289 RepID=UPI0011A5FB42|nr:RluA family pseudouridine synthase [Lutibacter sp. Hel_I_33_5]TVZ55566.1 23S rRNA pseudouridine1911/1915/1917 synthase [Lutibacter sp. Hel_I_33_5]